jgi:hypothetical protein
MCTGLEIAGAVVIGSAIVGTVAKVKGDIDSGNANADQQRRQAEIDEQNAKIADNLAVKETQDAEFEAGKIGDSAARLIGKQRVAAASDNVDVTTGSAAEAQTGTAEIAGEQRLLARLQGAWSAYGYRTQGAQYQATAAAHRAAAASYESAVPWAVTADVAQGASSALNWWAKGR